MPRVTAVEVKQFVDTVFGRLDSGVQAMVEERLVRRVVPCGTELWSVGDAAEELTFVLHGRLMVTVVEFDGDQRVAGEIGRGQAVGIAELVGRRARVATVTAVRETELLTLSAADFEAIVEAAPAFVLPLMRSLATRLGDALRGEQSFRAPETIAIVPLAPDLDTTALVAGLVREMKRHGSVHYLDAELVDARRGPGTARRRIGSEGEEGLLRWLDELDDHHDTDLYLTDPEDSAWTRRCLARADRILLLAPAGRDPGLRPIERLTDADGPVPSLAHRELIMVHQTRVDTPTDTAAWLEHRPIERTHHVRLGARGDLARVTRRLLNKTISIVLSGGAARGMVHIGVIRALLEAGVPIDAVGGTSAGGGVGVLLAAGFSADDMVAGITEAWIDSGVFTRVKVPIVSLLDSEPVRKAIIKWVGERDMKDLWRDCYVVASNITKGRLDVIDDGPAWHAIMCTSAIPGLLPPALRKGDVLVDGGLLDNMPVQEMLRRNPGRVIACDVGGDDDAIKADPTLLYCPPNNSLALERINPFDRDTKVPWIGTTLFASVTCGSRVRNTGCIDDLLLYLKPDLTGLPALDFKDSQPLLDAGYRAAMEALEQHTCMTDLKGLAHDH